MMDVVDILSWFDIIETGLYFYFIKRGGANLQNLELLNIYSHTGGKVSKRLEGGIIIGCKNLFIAFERIPRW